MDQACAVVDVQGFELENGFVAREVGICSDSLFTLCQELNPKLYFKNLSEKDQKTVIYCSRFKHGLNILPFHPVEHAFLPLSSDIGPLLKMYYEIVSSKEKPLLAFKNRRVGEILKQQGIPGLDLDDPLLKFPPISHLEDAYKSLFTCGYHKYRQPDVRYRCAYRKCQHIWTFIKSQLQEKMDD